MKKALGKNWQIPKFEIHNFHKRRTKYCICIPVLNEGDKIKKQLEKLLPFTETVDVIIADWGSTDGSTDPKFLKKVNVNTLLTLISPGRQGTQLRMGFSYALKGGYEGVIQIDGNNKDGMEAIPKFIKAFDEGYDYLQGSRFIKGGRAINTPLSRWIGVRIIASPIISLAARKIYTDVTNGFRGYSKKYLLHPKVQPFRKIFNNYEMNIYLSIKANQLKLKTKEIPVVRAYPKGKVPTKISIIRGNFNFLSTILKGAFGFYNP